MSWIEDNWSDIIDYHQDDYEEFDSGITCKYCGKEDLRWETVNGKYRLFDGNKLHICNHTLNAKEIEIRELKRKQEKEELIKTILLRENTSISMWNIDKEFDVNTKDLIKLLFPKEEIKDEKVFPFDWD